VLENNTTVKLTLLFSPIFKIISSWKSRHSKTSKLQAIISEMKVHIILRWLWDITKYDFDFYISILIFINLKTVKKLDLTHNNIDTRGATSLLNELEHNTVFNSIVLSLYRFLYFQTLTDLSLQCNKDSYGNAVALYVKMKNDPVFILISSFFTISYFILVIDWNLRLLWYRQQRSETCCWYDAK